MPSSVRRVDRNECSSDGEVEPDEHVGDQEEPLSGDDDRHDDGAGPLLGARALLARRGSGRRSGRYHRPEVSGQGPTTPYPREASPVRLYPIEPGNTVSKAVAVGNPEDLYHRQFRVSTPRRSKGRAEGRRQRARARRGAMMALLNNSSDRRTWAWLRLPKLHTRSKVSTPIAS